MFFLALSLSLSLSLFTLAPCSLTSLIFVYCSPLSVTEHVPHPFRNNGKFVNILSCSMYVFKLEMERKSF